VTPKTFRIAAGIGISLVSLSGAFYKVRLVELWADSISLKLFHCRIDNLFDKNLPCIQRPHPLLFYYNHRQHKIKPQAQARGGRF
jgi:hypothetical protein